MFSSSHLPKDDQCFGDLLGKSVDETVKIGSLKNKHGTGTVTYIGVIENALGLLSHVLRFGG